MILLMLMVDFPLVVMLVELQLGQMMMMMVMMMMMILSHTIPISQMPTTW